MFIQYDKITGQVMCTMICDRFPNLSGDWAEVPDQHLVNLSGWIIKDGQLVLGSLDPMKEDATSTIKQLVDERRRLFITDILGQEMIYETKRQEAVAYLALVTPPTDLSAFPFMEAEIGITAATAEQLAQLWLNMANLWVQAAAQMEMIRMHAAAELAQATTKESISGIVDDVKTALSSV